MLYHVGDSQHTQTILINKVTGEDEKIRLLFYRKNYMDLLANPIETMKLFLGRDTDLLSQ